MTRFERSLPLLMVLALWCATSRAAVGHDAGPQLDEPRASVSAQAQAAADSLTPAAVAQAGLPDTTKVQPPASSTPSQTAPPEASKDSRVDKRVWVILIAAMAVATLVVLAGR